jgi:hypothetical protein
MRNCEFVTPFREGESNNIIMRLRNWWQSAGSDEQYLAAASDPAEVERRMRALERASIGPAVVKSDD